jgi:two-component system cell cycle sensor histidine kinase/response regulator CckA
MSQTEDRDSLRRDALYRAVFEVNTAVKLVIDPKDGRIVDANGAAVDFYGWPMEVLCTMHIHDINTLTEDEVRAEMENARSLNRRYFRFRHRTASGEVRSVEVNSGPFELDGRELLFSVIHDVTERDQLEEHLRRSQRLEAIGQLAGGVAHDFNNLLTVMVSATQLARRRLPLGHEGGRYLDEIDAAARRGAALTRQLLAFSRRQVMAPRPIAIGDVVAHLVPLLERSLGPAYSIDVRGEAVPPVLADPAQVEQVVMNLVLNARDAMARGGVVEIAMAPSGGDGRALVPEGRWVRLDVIDQGVGMDEATRRRVFEPFFTTKPLGTGMGLASVYGIVAQSGGHVAVTSAPGVGSTFSVYLPVTSAVVAALPAEIEPRAARPATILLVDDVDAVRDTVAEVLRDLGHTVVVASSYDEAMAVVTGRLDTLDLVLTDAVMPGRSGLDLIRDLRASRPDLACVLMSGDLREHVVGELPERVLRLAKPFTLDALAAAVASLVQ